MSSQTMPPPGTVALVTGAGSGIGEAVADALAAIDCRVVCAGRRLGRVQAVASRLGDAGHALVLDVTDQAAVETLQDRLPEDWRDIGILVNNAGHDVGGRRRFDQGSAEEWARIVETNVIGLVRVTRQLIPGMVARGLGHVVNMGSVAGIRPYATGTLYVGTKHAVHGFSESLRRDFAGTGVRVTEILPGIVRTEFAGTRRADPEEGERFYEQFEECLEPADVARTVVFAVQQPAHVVISQIAVLASTQA